MARKRAVGEIVVRPVGAVATSSSRSLRNAAARGGPDSLGWGRPRDGDALGRGRGGMAVLGGQRRRNQRPVSGTGKDGARVTARNTNGGRTRRYRDPLFPRVPMSCRPTQPRADHEHIAPGGPRPAPPPWGRGRRSWLARAHATGTKVLVQGVHSAGGHGVGRMTGPGRPRSQSGTDAVVLAAALRPPAPVPHPSPEASAGWEPRLDDDSTQPGVLQLGTTLAAGTYTWQVKGTASVSFTLQVTYRTP
jgi:hypothetical protein